MRQPRDHVTGDAHCSFLRGLGDEVSNFSDTISSNSSKGVPFFSARSTAPSQVLIRKDASTMVQQSTWISRDPLSIKSTSSERREPRPVEPPVGVGVRVR